MKRKLLLLSLFISFGILLNAQTVGQTDNFQDGTTQGWFEPGISPNPPVNVADGGPLGAGDRYLSNSATGFTGAGGRMIMRNVTQWIGNFSGQGIDEIRFDAKALDNDLNFRVAFDGTGGKICSTTSVTVTTAAGWTEVIIPIDQSNMTTSFLNGGFDAAATLGDAFEMRILSNTNPDWRGEFISATMEIDNIEARSTTLSTPWLEPVDTFKITPNPSRSVLNISLSSIDSDTKIEVFDVLGKRVFYSDLDKLITRFDVRSWNDGIYLVRLSSSSTSETKRFIKH
ncbi:MAG: T9SS type A sorting domain-containing protein [Flavobacteriaceae bacterium]|nr:T9SS type A sorting domain-containing protein [Bacteroidia bacterium]MBT8286425.1 T9SS type A sorting domain-containing protein [Bacteroidia bacterium]NNF75926.1 T9SS type A sorting domain-containing protein [Flavobacteriaceae bacterium]NNK73396.1 T9SS type A sorting domain-containing protein [Flavobacteriaceae bacterium]